MDNNDNINNDTEKDKSKKDESIKKLEEINNMYSNLATVSMALSAMSVISDTLTNIVIAQKAKQVEKEKVDKEVTKVLDRIKEK